MAGTNNNDASSKEATSTPSGCPMLTEDPESWNRSSLLSVTQITPSGLQLLFSVAQTMRSLVLSKGGDNRLSHRLLGSVFFEASTRTSCSFQAAMMRLGGKFIHVDGQGNSSAGKKGETLEDTIRCLECYTDVTVLRHPVQGCVGKVIEMAKKPVINAGDGIGEHPTQALLDAFTIVDELKLDYENKSSLTVVLLGDLKHGRTVHSLAKMLAQSNISNKLILRYCSPQGLEMPENVRGYISKNFGSTVEQEDYTDLKACIKGSNVLYVTRIQRERFDSDEDYNKVKGSYVVDLDLLNEAPSNMIILHPLPRVDEIATAVDSDSRAAYFRQMENGMYVRMALLSLILGCSNNNS